MLFLYKKYKIFIKTISFTFKRFKIQDNVSKGMCTFCMYVYLKGYRKKKLFIST